MISQEQIDELCDFLEGPDGCDFQQSDPGDAKTISWRCGHVLAKTPQWLETHGLSKDAVYWHACCDCEVFFNAPRSDDDEGEE